MFCQTGAKSFRRSNSKVFFDDSRQTKENIKQLKKGSSGTPKRKKYNCITARYHRYKTKKSLRLALSKGEIGKLEKAINLAKSNNFMDTDELLQKAVKLVDSIRKRHALQLQKETAFRVKNGFETTTINIDKGYNQSAKYI
mmetsp:Transcript_1667/g.2020  ORF Transcript_1667/g.2020 Transcript_1667/m.2020 type:complete len:141 (+) Transcript_1667:90-512(+)